MTSFAANTGHYASEAQALDAVVARIVDQIDPEAVWLFGSRARGTHRPDSDFDLLVVTRLADGDSGHDYDRVYAPVLVLGTGVGCDVVPCRLDDFEREAGSRTGLVREVLDAGVSLYDKSKARQSPPGRTTSPPHRPDTAIPTHPAACPNRRTPPRSGAASPTSPRSSPSRSVRDAGAGR